MHLLLASTILRFRMQENMFEIVCYRNIHSCQAKMGVISIILYFYVLTQGLQEPVTEFVQSDKHKREGDNTEL
jgi:hypothetical protein